MKTWYAFDTGKSLRRSLEKKGIWEKFKSWCSSCADFLDKSSNPETQIQCMHALHLLIDKHFKSTMPPDVLNVAVMEALKFCIPNNGRVRGRAPAPTSDFDGPLPPCIFIDAKLLVTYPGLLTTPMGGSVIFQQKPTAASAKVKAQAKKQGKNPSPAAKKARSSENVEEQPKVTVGDAASDAGAREKLWLDDVWSAIEVTIKTTLPEGKVLADLFDSKNKDISHAIAVFFSFAYEFCWRRELTLSSSQEAMKT